MSSRLDATRPLFVAEGEHAYRALVEEFLGAGWRLAPAEGRAETPAPDVVAVCSVTEPAAAGWAVLAATRGPVLVHAATDRTVVDDLVDDLARLGPVTLTTDGEAVELDQDTWRLLHLLGGGVTVGSAAQSLHMSLRTANRRLTTARDAFGASSRAGLLRAAAAERRVPLVGTLSRR